VRIPDSGLPADADRESIGVSIRARETAGRRRATLQWYVDVTGVHMFLFLDFGVFFSRGQKGSKSKDILEYDDPCSSRASYGWRLVCVVRLGSRDLWNASTPQSDMYIHLYALHYLGPHPEAATAVVQGGRRRRGPGARRGKKNLSPHPPGLLCFCLCPPTTGDTVSSSDRRVESSGENVSPSPPVPREPRWTDGRLPRLMRSIRTAHT